MTANPNSKPPKTETPPQTPPKTETSTPTTPAPTPLRMSIWSVTADLMPAYLILFDILAAIGVAYVVWHNIWGLTADSVHATIWGIITGVVTVGIASAIISILILETGKHAMIVGTYFERKFKHRREQELAAARVEARGKGIAEFNALIDEWEKRRDEALEKGEPFDEPMPRLKE